MIDEHSTNFPEDPVEPNAMYELRVNGRLDQAYTEWFDDMTLTVDDNHSPPQTVIHAHIRDQSALYGLISRIRDLGLDLLSVNKLEQKEDP